MQNTANGTTWVTRGVTLVAISSMIAIIVTMNKTVEPDLFNFPRPIYFVCTGIYLVIPLFWILFNTELRLYKIS